MLKHYGHIKKMQNKYYWWIIKKIKNYKKNKELVEKIKNIIIYNTIIFYEINIIKIKWIYYKNKM
jgi:PIN domain nuclease of toxin-antitoxin system